MTNPCAPALVFGRAAAGMPATGGGAAGLVVADRVDAIEGADVVAVLLVVGVALVVWGSPEQAVASAATPQATAAQVVACIGAAGRGG